MKQRRRSILAAALMIGALSDGNRNMLDYDDDKKVSIKRKSTITAKERTKRTKLRKDAKKNNIRMRKRK